MTDSSKPLQAIVVLSGVVGAGKTVLANALGDELSPASVLFIDASPDQQLTTMLAPKVPELTLGRLFSQKTEATGSREAIDWVFHDLTVPAGNENDLLTVGALPEVVEPEDQQKLCYGLNRLIQNYAYVVVDGDHPLLGQLLPEEMVRPLAIVTPADFPAWRPPAAEDPGLHTPSLILNRYSEEPLPTALDEAIDSHQVRLIGKLPCYASPEDCIRKLSDDFRNCLLRLDIPLSPGAPS